MKRYQLDPKNLRQLTPEEQRRLDAMPIDYSDIPPLDDEFFKAAKHPKMKKTYPFESDPISLVVASALKELLQESSPDDEATEYGRFSPEHEPIGEEELYAIIFDLVEQDCLTDNDDLDSWAIRPMSGPSSRWTKRALFKSTAHATAFTPRFCRRPTTS